MVQDSQSDSSIKNKQEYELYLIVNANRAADLVTNNKSDDSQQMSKKSVNPVLVAQLNNFKKSTSKKSHTAQPSWDQQLTIPLTLNDYSQILILTVWDKHKRYKTYLGEVRLCISDIFHSESKFQSKSDLKWYQLYSNQDSHSFVTGSLLLSFELAVRQKRSLRKWGRKRAISIEKKTPGRTSLLKNDSNQHPEVIVDLNNQTPVLKIEPPSRAATEEMNSKLEEVNLSDNESITSGDINKANVLNDWIQSLLYSDSLNESPNDQGFYPANNLFDQSDIDEDVKKKSHLNRLSSDFDASSMSDSSFSDANYSDSSVTGTTKIKKSKLRKLRLHGSGRSGSTFEFSNRKVHGVLFIEVVSCLNLPPLRNATKTSFDMDPFVVVTFGKKTFRTSWKRHDLNPIFNERLAFEVLGRESNFDIQFTVFDKDTFTNHDKVGTVSIPLRDITNEPTKYADESADGSLFTTDDYMSTTDNENPSSFSKPKHEDNIIQLARRGKFTRRKKITSAYVDTSDFQTMNLPLKLFKEKYESNHKSELKIRVRFETYSILRRKFWKILLDQYDLNEKENEFDAMELLSLLDTLGCTYSEHLVDSFYAQSGKLKSFDLLTKMEVIDRLEEHIIQKPTDTEEKIFEFEKCPICNNKRLTKKDDVDIITHVAICASKDWSIANKMLVSSFISPQIATRKWLPRILKKITYGGYKLGGGNSANILVQDRVTGIVLEEKMSVYVRLGIRLLYNGLDKAKSKRVRKLLKQLSIKQGTKFDDPQLKSDIKSFIKFHGLDLSDCLEPDSSKYPTFNEFFYRKLKPGARPIEGEKESRIAISPADCRCTAFATVNHATELWIKGRNFTIAKLFNGNYNGYENTDLYKPDKCSVAIFRLAPQDYHRFHSPVDGSIGKIKYIEGEYYTVNPMAIRSHLDVFGENVRAIIPIETKDFGTVIMVAVGAMMVGSTVLTVQDGQTVTKGDEIGYFKFGGSTIILLFENERFRFDSDLIANSKTKVETLVRVGQSIGHLADIPELVRERVDFSKQSKDFKLNLIRILTGGDLGTAAELSDWESRNIKLDHQDLDDLISEEENEELDEDDSDFDEEGLIDS